ncbi:MAG: hypothetical protein KDK45_23615, partial [Leptospiraceae bacterium]|nr:hypothetical protein [Leptospiraceae bacterium]
MASLLQKAEKFIQLHIEEAPEAFSKKKRTLYERLEEIQARFYEKEYAKPVQFDEETFELPIPGEEPNLQNEKDPFDDWEKEALEEQGFEEKKSELSTREISSPDSEEKFVSTSHPQDNELEEDKQRQIEEYLALIEISKEIIKSGSFEEYFENIMYGILGQYGVDSFMLFSNLNLEEDYQLIKQDGLEEEISFKLKYQGKLKHLLTEQKGIIEFQTLSSSSIDESEFSFMKETNTRIIIPLFSNEKLFCIILMGEMISGDDYTGSDFEIIEIFCEFAGNFFNNVSEYEQKNKTLENLTDLARSSLETFTLTDKFTFCNKLEDAYDIISGYLSSVLEIKRLTIILNTGNFETSYKIVYTNQFQEKTSEKFILDSSDSEFLEKLQKGIDLYEFSISEQDEFV